MLSIFLQILDTIYTSSAEETTKIIQNQAIQNSGGKMNFLSLLFNGGLLMIPLILLFIIALWVFFERWFVIKHAGKYDKRFISIIREHIMSGNIASARNFAQSGDGPIYKVIDKGVQRIGKPIDIIENSMENVGKVELYKLERRISTLSIIAGIAPMFGFLGTIVGMIQLFFNISSSGEYTLNTIAAGIYTKMITSASGLIIGLLAYVGYSYLNALLDRVVHRIESTSADFMDILQEPVTR